MSDTATPDSTLTQPTQAAVLARPSKRDIDTAMSARFSTLPTPKATLNKPLYSSIRSQTEASSS